LTHHFLLDAIYGGHQGCCNDSVKTRGTTRRLPAASQGKFSIVRRLMTKILMLAFSLLISGAWSQAQDAAPPAGNPSDHPTERTSVFKGCLQVSTGIFTLTDDSGMTYQIQGDTSKLREHLGHEVQITGTASTSDASQGSGASTNSSQQPTIHLRAVKHLSKTCESAKN